jgi:glycosyltransferase involved in cell wall biosynthesis
MTAALDAIADAVIVPRLNQNPTSADAARESCDVSVVIPAYNRAELLRWPLASIAAQTVLPVEVIVVDDCSAPAEAAKMRAIVDEYQRLLNIRILMTERNGGQSAARNRGLHAALGKYVATLDSDDLWLPEYLEKQMRAIEAAKRHDSRPILSATGTYRVDEEGNILHCKRGRDRFDPARIQKSNYISASAMIVEASAARAVGGYDEDMRNGSDWEFLLRLVSRVQFASVADPLGAVVVHHEERLSENSAKTLGAMLLIRRRHLRGVASLRENPGFYRNVARGLQARGKIATAKKFYIRSLALRWPGGLGRHLVEAWLGLYFTVREIPSLKERRNAFYLKKLHDQRANPKTRTQWDRDQEVIKALMTRRPVGGDSSS